MESIITKVLVIIPAYNEEESIVSVINDLYSLSFKPDIIVINDGSLDRTSEVAKSSGKAIVVDLPTNLGIGGGVQTGFKYAIRNSYDIAIQCDGDGQHRADEIDKILTPILKEDVDLVIGSRFLQRHKGFQSTFVRRIGIKLFEFLNLIIIRHRITDNTSGFRAYNREAVKFLSHYYPTDYPEPESVILLSRNGFKIKEVSVSMKERQGGRSSISGLKSIYYMIKVILAIIMTSFRAPIRNNSKG